MKNVTLSIPDDLLAKSHSYAHSHGTTLNEMIRELLRKSVYPEAKSLEERLEKFRKDLSVDTRIKFTKDELHER